MAIEDQRFYEHDGVDDEGDPAGRAQEPRSGRGRSRAARRSPSSWCATSASPTPSATIERKIVEAKLAVEYAKRHSQAGNPRPVPQHRLLRDDRGQHRGRRPGGLADLLRPAGLEADPARRRRCWPGCRRRPPNTTRSSTPSAATARRNQVLRRWPSSATSPPSARRTAQRRGLGLDVSDELLRAPPALLLRLRRERADRGVRGQHRAPGRPRGAHDDRPGPAGGRRRKRCARPSPTRPTPPRRWSRSTPATATSGRWSPAPTTTETQFNLAAQGRRQPGSTFKTFVLTTAIKQGIDPYSTYYTSKPLDLDLPDWGHWYGRHRRRGLPGHGQPAAGDGHAPTTPSSPSSTSTSAPRRSPRRRSRWGSRRSSTGSRPRGSAACGSASRRWR